TDVSLSWRVAPSILQQRSYHAVGLIRKIAGVAGQQEEFRTSIRSARQPVCRNPLVAALHRRLSE
ncbi:MAG TPA: hypothetical protein VMY42_01590, partial [Thermoguttaceae bacterium]|nr:hypothetical protein [Thermoguttaceae bacterium]